MLAVYKARSNLCQCHPNVVGTDASVYSQSAENATPLFSAFEIVKASLSKEELVSHNGRTNKSTAGVLPTSEAKACWTARFPLAAILKTDSQHIPSLSQCVNS